MNIPVTAALGFRLRSELQGLLAVRSLRWAVLLMVLGAGLWFRQETRPASTAAGPAGERPAPAMDRENRSPALFRLGAGYAGGFLLMFMLRRFLRVTTTVAGLLLATVAGLRALGWVEWDWAAVDTHIRTALSWSHEQAGALKALLEGYLPSTAATGIGLWRGFRRSMPKVPPPAA